MSTPIPMAEQTCATCRFFSGPLDGPLGECRQQPPSLMPRADCDYLSLGTRYEMTWHPVRAAHDTCGQWQATPPKIETKVGGSGMEIRVTPADEKKGRRRF